jgi:hypothetical protein
VSPALVTDLIAVLSPTSTHAHPTKTTRFRWNRFVARKEVRDTGALHDKGVRAEFENEAGLLVVGRSEAVAKEIRFHPIADGEITAGEYQVIVEARLVGSSKRWRSMSRTVTITTQHLEEARSKVINDESGKHLYSYHVRIALNPELDDQSGPHAGPLQ